MHGGKLSHGLGAALMKDRRDGTRYFSSTALHTTDINDSSHKIVSITECNNLEDFLEKATLAETDFSADKNMAHFVNNNYNSNNGNSGNTSSSVVKPQLVKSREQAETEKLNKKYMTVPRRPFWNEETTPSELDANERSMFLEWRRNLAKVEEIQSVVMTPFEKNLQMWRQLWRVLERSDVVCQIVDARNPTLYRCSDLERYVKEIDKIKQNVLIVNKADLLPETLRIAWATYFVSKKVKFIFWSAKQAELLLEEQLGQEKEQELDDYDTNYDNNNNNDNDDDDGGYDAIYKKKKSFHNAKEYEVKGEDDEEEEDFEDVEEITELNENSFRETIVHTRDEMLAKLKLLAIQVQQKRKERDAATAAAANGDDGDGDYMDVETKEIEKELAVDENGKKDKEGENNDDDANDDDDDEEKEEEEDEEDLSNPKLFPVIGFVGYPNVGKSSTINMLLMDKKLAVSATPGKTKHFQTMMLRDDRVTLCDCPGLVFPQFAISSADMVCNGILPIDQLREYVGPTQLLTHRIPRGVLERVYGIKMVLPSYDEDRNRSPYYNEFLDAFCHMRGFTTTGGGWDHARAARVVLKDFVNGKLLYCSPPPNVSSETFQYTAEATAQLQEELLPEKKRLNNKNNNKEDHDDDNNNNNNNNSQSQAGSSVPLYLKHANTSHSLYTPNNNSNAAKKNLNFNEVDKDFFEDAAARKAAASGGNIIINNNNNNKAFKKHGTKQKYRGSMLIQ